MPGRDGLTNQAWERIEPMLPHERKRGGQFKNHRQVIDGILWKIRTGARWSDIPARYAPHQTCYSRFRKWCEDGTWARILQELRRKEPVDATISVDSTIVRVHQNATGRLKKETIIKRIKQLDGAVVG